MRRPGGAESASRSRTIPRAFLEYNLGPSQSASRYRTESTVAKKKTTYRIIFHNQGKVYELYSHTVRQGDLFGFIEIGDIIFGERSAVLIDPSEERLKMEFSGVSRTCIPMHAVVRIDQVDKQGVNKIVTTEESKGQGNVTPFPVPIFTPGGDPGSSGN